MLLREPLPQRRRRPVHGRRIVGEKLTETGRPAVQRVEPHLRVGQTALDLEHVVAGRVEESFEGDLQRVGAGASEAGADDAEHARLQRSDGPVEHWLQALRSWPAVDHREQLKVALSARVVDAFQPGQELLSGLGIALAVEETCAASHEVRDERVGQR